LSAEGERALIKVGYRYPESIEFQWDDEDDDCGCSHLPAELYEEDRAGIEELLAAGLIVDRGYEFQVSPGAIFATTPQGQTAYDRLTKHGKNFIRAVNDFTGRGGR